MSKVAIASEKLTDVTKKEKVFKEKEAKPTTNRSKLYQNVKIDEKKKEKYDKTSSSSNFYIRSPPPEYRVQRDSQSCYNCYKTGHTTNQCLKPRKYQSNGRNTYKNELIDQLKLDSTPSPSGLTRQGITARKVAAAAAAAKRKPFFPEVDTGSTDMLTIETTRKLIREGNVHYEEKSTIKFPKNLPPNVHVITHHLRPN